MNAAELYAHYWNHPLPIKPPPEPVVSDGTTQVLPYTQWVKMRCKCCGRQGGVSGVWTCEFTNGQEIMLLCAACAFYDAFAKWTGFFSRKILKIDLIATLTYPSRTVTE